MAISLVNRFDIRPESNRENCVFSFYLYKFSLPIGFVSKNAIGARINR